MRTNYLIFALMLMPVSALAFGQTQIRSDQGHLKAQRLMDQFSSGKISQAHALQTIEAIQANGLKPTTANAEKVLRLLAGANDISTKINLLRLLGTLYTPNDDTKRNFSIARTLKTFVYSTDHRIALAAIQAYARIDYQNDRNEILDYGLQNRILNDNSYSQELAIFIPLYPPAAQYDAAKRLAARNNKFGAEVLALTIDNSDVIKSITPESRSVLLSFLQKQEPQMPRAIGEFGLNDGGRYADWLNTVALLTTEGSGRASYADVVFSHLNDPHVDPRKILGYMTSADGKRFIKHIGSRAPFAQAAARASLLADQFPDHPIFGPLARDVDQTLATLRE